jgi:uncharacterized protein YdhG (YjbR/CyaY superfamily)
MRSGMRDVNSYVDKASDRRRPTLVELRDLCREVLTDFDEEMVYGMPSYKRDGTTEIAFANQ